MVRGLLYRRKRAARKYRFHPPRHVAPCMTFARWLAPRYSRWVLGVTRVTVSPADAARLRQLRRERVVLTPNHPTQDPAVLFHFSTMLGMQFYWLAAREVFETTFQGWLVSRVGAYSVDRGTRDSDAVHMTRQLLTEGRHWLVLFPEGVNHFLHDVVMPFLPGAARIGLGALDDLAARGGELPPLYTVPLALRYHYTADMRPKMDAALRRLERKLRLDGAGGNDWHGRMDAIADRILDANEEFFGVMPQPDESLPQRLGRLREVVLSRGSTRPAGFCRSSRAGAATTAASCRSGAAGAPSSCAKSCAASRSSWPSPMSTTTWPPPSRTTSTCWGASSARSLAAGAAGARGKW